MIDPLRAEPSPYETLGVAVEASDVEILAAFKTSLARGKDTPRSMRALRTLQDPVERTLVDVLEYQPAALAGLSPSPLDDPSALDEAHRAATARAWEQQLVARFPDLGMAHSLAVLWHWWTEHDGSDGLETRPGDPSLAEKWERSIAYWSLLVNAEAFWQQRCPGDGEVGRRAGQRIVEDLRNRLDRACREHRARHDDEVADALQKLEAVLDTEIDMGARIARGGVSTPNGKVTCGPLLLRDLGLLDAVTQRVNRALDADPSNGDLGALRDALSPRSHVATLIRQEQPQQALDALAALPAAERDAPQALAMRAQALRLLGEQAASVGEFDRALKVWKEAIEAAPTTEEAATIRSAVSGACLQRVAGLPASQRDAAISLLDKTRVVADDEHLRTRHAELLFARGIDTINRAQEKIGTSTPESLEKAIRKGVKDLDRSAELGSDRAKEQAAIGHDLLEKLHGGMLGVPDAIAVPLAAANAAAAKDDWDTAVASLTKALAAAGPKPPDVLRANLAVCLANRANEKANRAVGMLNRGASIDDGLRALTPAWRRVARRAGPLGSGVAVVLGTLLRLATGAAIAIWIVDWALGSWLPDAIESVPFLTPIHDWIATSPNVMVLAGVLGVAWILAWATRGRGGKRRGKHRSFYDSPCAICGQVARYEVRATTGRVHLCEKHATRLETWMKDRPRPPAALELLSAACEDMKRAAKTAPEPAQYERQARDLGEAFKQALTGARR